MTVASLAVSIVALGISVAFAVRAEHRYRHIDEPELTLDVGAFQTHDSRMPIPVTVRWLKGSLEARDIHVLVRIQYRIWHARCPDLGPHHPGVHVQAQYISATDVTHLGLPDRPFLTASRETVIGDCAAAVTWVAAGRRHWAGHLVTSRNGGPWQVAGPTVRGSHPLR
jgi:hypothetical protein